MKISQDDDMVLTKAYRQIFCRVSRHVATTLDSIALGDTMSVVDTVKRKSACKPLSS